MDKSYRYKQIDQLLQYEDGYTLLDIAARLDDDVSTRTIQREIENLQKAPYNVKLHPNLYKGKTRLYRYLDTSFSLYDNQNEIKKKFDNVMIALEKLAGIPQYDWMRFFLIELSNGMMQDDVPFVSFENNLDLEGLEHIHTLAKAIVHHQPLKISYRPFNGTEKEVHLHPYHLRQFNNRWFLIGGVDGKGYIGNYPLDRILNVADLAKTFVETNINFDEYFEDIIGVSVPKTNVEEVLLKVRNERYNYISTKPLHGTQREHKDMNTDTHTIISIQVKINKELVTRLASYGADVEVLSPQSLRERMAEIAKQLFNIYNPKI